MGFSVTLGNPIGTVMHADNCSFDGTLKGGVISTDGQLFIGSAAIPHIRPGVLSSPLGTLTIGYASPNITIDIAGGGAAIQKVNLQSGTTPIVPLAGAITFNGGIAAAGTHPVITDGTGPSTMALNVQISQAIAVSNNANIGLSAFDSAAFSVDVNGFVKTGINRFPITPYVVGPVGQAGYQTIQSALDAANLAGGGIVYVQSGTYTESLTLYATTEVVGVPGNSDGGTAGNTTIIIGVHTPPATGSFTFANVRLQSATHIFNSSVAGSASLILENIFIAVTNGFVFNLTNWTGTFITYNVGEGSTNNGMVNNTGGASCFFISATHGAGTGNAMLTSGPVIMQEVDLNCPWSAATGTTISCDYDIFTHTVTCANNSTGSFNYCKFNTGSTAALTMSSSAAISLLHSIINTSNNPAITGAGAGVFTYSDVVFVNNAAFAGTLTLAKNSWQPYSVALASTDGTKVGTCNFNSAQFTVDANGFVSTTGIAANAFNQVKNQVFTSGGTYTPTTGMKYVQIICTGGGGAGGGAATTTGSNTSCGSGGGAGEYAVGIFTAATIGGSQTITIGAGGTGVSGTTGNSGGTSSVGSLITAVGGTGGIASGAASLIATADGAAGGTGGTGGDYRCDGANGTFGVSAFGVTGATIQGHGGDGGNSQLGPGGKGALGAAAGGGGHLHSAGGGGALTFASAANAGGAGTSGIIVITEYISV